MARYPSDSDDDRRLQHDVDSRSSKRKRDDTDEARDRRRRSKPDHRRTRRRYSESISPERSDRRRRPSPSRSPARRRSPSPSRRRHRSRSPRSSPRRRYAASRSRSPKRRPRSPSHSPPPRSRKPLPPQDQSYVAQGGSHQDRRGPYKGQSNRDGPSDALDKPIEKQKPNYKPSGLLAAESNKVTVSGGLGKNPKSIVLKYHEPSEARKPPSSQAWSCYVFKGDGKDPVQTIPLHTRSCWLLGRETTVADIPIEHPSCSKQHAVFQFRYLQKKDEWGEKKGKVGLYLIDLESANGTFLNEEKVEPARYVECLNGDVVKFGESEREYVILLPPKE